MARLTSVRRQPRLLALSEGITDSGAEFGPVGYEVNLLYLVGLLALVLSGPGRLSVDRWLRHRRDAARR